MAARKVFLNSRAVLGGGQLEIIVQRFQVGFKRSAFAHELVCNYFAQPAPENDSVKLVQACIDRRRPAFLDLRYNGELAATQGLRHVIHECNVYPGLVHVEDQARQAADRGSDGQPRRAPHDADQRADEQPDRGTDRA